MIKKGEILLRDVVFIMLVMSSVLIFASTFVTEMAGNYGNTEMAEEFALTNLSMSGDSGLMGGLKDTTTNISDQLQNKDDDSSGLWTLITGTKDIVVNVIWAFLSAPNDLGSLIGDILVDMGAAVLIAETIKWIIVVGLWIVVIFAIITAFLQGAKI